MWIRFRFFETKKGLLFWKKEAKNFFESRGSPVGVSLGTRAGGDGVSLVRATVPRA
jgi:hypothetical protein